MLPTIDPDLFQIKGGNMQLPQRLLQRSNVSLHRPAIVQSVEALHAGNYQLEVIEQSGSKVQMH